MHPMPNITVIECRAMAAVSRRLVAESRQLLSVFELSKHTSPHRWRSIAVGLPRELRHWSAVLGCSEGELRSAVSAVGVMVEDVRAELLRRRALKSPADATR